MENTIIAVIATASALISSLMALISWWYNRELSRATISLMEVKVEGKRVDKDKLSINFSFFFKNVSRETLRISELRFGHYDFRGKIFEQIGQKSILNPIHAESVFNYQISFTINIDPQIPTEKIGEILPAILGKHAIILRLKYRGTSVFSRKEISLKYFLGYEGYGQPYYLTRDEYREIEKELPQEFRLGKS